MACVTSRPTTALSARGGIDVDRNARTVVIAVYSGILNSIDGIHNQSKALTYTIHPLSRGIFRDRGDVSIIA